VDQLQRCLTEEADRREVAGQRIETIFVRVFRVMLIMVCLNMVIAGANVAMIATRSSASRQATSPPPTQSVPAAPIAGPATQPAPAVPVANPPEPAPTPPATEAPALAQPASAEKKVRLLGPLASSSRPGPVLARRQTRAPVKPRAMALGFPGAYEDYETDEAPSGPVERW
jgi:hypothetical protein